MLVSSFQPENFLARLALIALLVLPLQNCADKSSAEKKADLAPKRAIVTDGGKTIAFPKGSKGLAQIKTAEAKEGNAIYSVSAPARVVASFLFGKSSKEKTILFESPDITTIYSSFRQARVTAEQATKNLERLKDMFEHQAATARDLSEAETFASNARAALNEAEAKLRILGFNTVELESTPGGMVWLIADVSESQLHEVEKGEDVGIVFSAFSDATFNGRVAAIGDVVDGATRTVKVRVVVPNPKGKFLPGMFARVEFAEPENKVIALPSSVAVTVDGRDYAFVQTADTAFERRTVAIAKTDGSRVIISKGVSEGEKVVIEGAMLLKGLSFGY